MRTKITPGFLVAGALLLVLVAVRFAARPVVRTASQSEPAAAAIHPPKRPAATVAHARPVSSRRSSISVGASRREPGPDVAGLLDRLKSCDAAQRAVEIARFVAEADLAEMQAVLVDDLQADPTSGPALPEDVSQAMLRRIAHEDAPWTADYLPAMPATDTFRGELLGTTMVEWGGADIPAAVEWAQKLTDRSLQETALVHLSYRWFETDPVGALAYAALHPTEHRQLLTTLVGQWTREQPEAAAAWAAEFSQEPVMTNVAASAVAAWAQKDDLAAAEFVLKLPDGQLREQASISVMSAFAQHDPATGAMWATAFPAGPNRDYAIENLVYRWATSDPGSALSWASHLPPDERDTAIFAGAGGLVDRDPALAASWALAIQDESRRNRQAERAAQAWMQTDPAAARQWILAAPLSAEHKQRLLASGRSGS